MPTSFLKVRVKPSTSRYSILTFWSFSAFFYKNIGNREFKRRSRNLVRGVGTPPKFTGKICLILARNWFYPLVFFLYIMTAIVAVTSVAVTRSGSITHDGNSEMIPFSSVLPIQISVPSAKACGSVEPTIA